MPVWKDAADAAQFVRQYSNMILRICFTYSLGRADAQDICQNVFLKLLQSDRRFDSEGETRAFIIRMTVNECKDVLKSGWRRRSVPLDELIERETPFFRRKIPACCPRCSVCRSNTAKRSTFTTTKVTTQRKSRRWSGQSLPPCGSGSPAHAKN